MRRRSRTTCVRSRPYPRPCCRGTGAAGGRWSPAPPPPTVATVELQQCNGGEGMSAILKPKSKLVVCDGNEAAAWAVSLANVDMVAVYPITPQSSLVEYLAKFIADGRLGAELVDVEGGDS